MEYMFYGCESLTTIPELNTTNVTNMRSMFGDCALTSIPELNTTNVTDMSTMFSGCTSLTSISKLDTTNVINMSGMFSNCKLTTIPQLDTTNVTNMYNMFYNCPSLTTIPELNTSNVTNMNSMLIGCRSLTSVKLKGVKQSLSLSSSPLLDSESVHYLLNNVQEGNNLTITFNNTSPGYNDLYTNDESYINATSKGWTIVPEVIKVERPLPNPFKVVYADSLDKYNQLTNPDPNTMYIIGEGANEMIIFNNQIIGNRGTSITRL